MFQQGGDTRVRRLRGRRVRSAGSAGDAHLLPASISASSCGPARPRAIGWEGGWRLRNRLAIAAGHFLPHILNHFPARRHPLQCLGHVLAQLAQPSAAAARAGLWRWQYHTLAGKMIRQRTAGRGTPPLFWCRRTRCRSLLCRDFAGGCPWARRSTDSRAGSRSRSIRRRCARRSSKAGVLEFGRFGA